jgi:DNA (cytosine-5)-methyltransferase 1
MTKPIMLDICCRQGGATRGYQRAGFIVWGVDVEPQPRYIGERFIQADGLEILQDSSIMRHVSAVHTSWPCQGYSATSVIMQNDHPKLIEPGRELLDATGLPYVQENVEGAPLKNPIMLCGATFGLNTYRHRLFESNVTLTAPEHERHTRTAVKMGRLVRPGDLYQAIGNFSGVDYVRQDMGVPWMTREGIRECIPPIYAEYVGRQLIKEM